MTFPRGASGPVQDAMFARLVDDRELLALGVGVFDEVGEGAPLPYVVVGETAETPTGVHGRFGAEVVATLHVWSDYRGNAEVNTIADRVVALFHEQPLDVPGFGHLSSRSEYRQTLRDPARGLRRVVVRFRIIVFQED